MVVVVVLVVVVVGTAVLVVVVVDEADVDAWLGSTALAGVPIALPGVSPDEPAQAASARQAHAPIPARLSTT